MFHTRVHVKTGIEPIFNIRLHVQIESLHIYTYMLMYIYSELPISKPPEPHPKIDLRYSRSRSFLDPSGMKALQIDEELHNRDLTDCSRSIQLIKVSIDKRLCSTNRFYSFRLQQAHIAPKYRLRHAVFAVQSCNLELWQDTGINEKGI